MTEYYWEGSDILGHWRAGKTESPPFAFAVGWLDGGGLELNVFDDSGEAIAGVQHLGHEHYEAWMKS